MKVLKLKDHAKFKDHLIRRGDHAIKFVPDADGNYVVSINILQDPVYDDLVELILDSCEVIDYKPIELGKLPDHPRGQVKGEFAEILRNARNLEEAVTIYYDTRPGVLGRAMNAINKNIVQPVINFFNE